MYNATGTGKGKSRHGQGQLSHLSATLLGANSFTAQVSVPWQKAQCCQAQGSKAGQVQPAGSRDLGMHSEEFLLWLHRMHFKNHDTSGNSHPKLNIYWLTALRRIQELPQTTVKFKNMDTSTYYYFSLQQSLFPHRLFLATSHCPFCCSTVKRRKK